MKYLLFLIIGLSILAGGKKEKVDKYFVSDEQLQYKQNEIERFMRAYQNRDIQPSNINDKEEVIVKYTPKQMTDRRNKQGTLGIHLASVGIPFGYYQEAIGKSGKELRHAIQSIIQKEHKALSYDKIWEVLEQADENPVDSNQVWLIYSEYGMNKDEKYLNKHGWSREHVWAKSHGDFGTKKGPGTDAHSLRAIEQNENSRRNNLNFGWIFGPKTKNQFVYEPPESSKGDVARSIFYMSLRWDMNVDNEDEISKAARIGIKDDLFKWHYIDPVDHYEIKRNNIVFKFQKNRNPFIDHPELLEYIFGDRQNEPWFGNRYNY